MKWFFRAALSVMVLMLGLSWVSALADDAGVLTEGELGRWVSQTLLETKGIEPQNAPVGEDSLTEEGYAFLYSFATLYYNKPILDQHSVLQGFAVTDEKVETPRGIRLGSPVEALIGAYGWQNPEFFGDGSFAALYQLSQFPEGAYWCWARLSEDGSMTVQCAVHALSGGSSMYTDAGVLYQVRDGVVTAIRVYGLGQLITLEEAKSNLRAVTAVQAASSGDDVMDEERVHAAEGNYQKSAAPPFGWEDLAFGKVDFQTLGEMGAALVFGKPQEEEAVQDDTGDWLHIVGYGGATLTFALDKNQQNARLESMSMTGEGMEGPRGLLIGETVESALMRFQSDGTGMTLEGEAILYGNGQAAPYGAMTRMGSMTTLRYVATVTGEDGMEREVTLRLSFADGRLVEILIYSW